MWKRESSQTPLWTLARLYQIETSVVPPRPQREEVFLPMKKLQFREVKSLFHGRPVRK